MSLPQSLSHNHRTSERHTLFSCTVSTNSSTDKYKFYKVLSPWASLADSLVLASTANLMNTINEKGADSADVSEGNNKDSYIQLRYQSTWLQSVLQQQVKILEKSAHYMPIVQQGNKIISEGFQGSEKKPQMSKRQKQQLVGAVSI